MISPTQTVLAFLSLVASSAMANWPQFRGPLGHGIAEGPEPPSQLTEKNIAWKVALPGRGLASPIVWGNKVFISASSGPLQERLHVLCFSTDDGKLLWDRQFQATGRTMSHEKTSVAAPTPCTDGKRVFSLYSTNDLFCLDFDGNVQWLRGLTHDYPNASNSLGMASSLVVVDDTLVAMVENDSDSFTTGLDVTHGHNSWKMARTKIANWTTPVLWKHEQKTNIGLMSSDGVVGVDPATGSQLWKIEGGSVMPSCAISGTKLYVPSKGMTAYDLSKTGQPPAQMWTTSQLSSSTATPVASGDFVYAVNSAGVLAKGNASDGSTVWKTRLNGKFSGSPVMAGKWLYIASEEGSLKVVDTAAEPEGVVVSDLKLGGTFLCTPAISDGAIYVRTDEALWKISK